MTRPAPDRSSPGARQWPLSVRLTLVAMATLVPITILTVLSYLDEQRDRRASAVETTRAYGESVAANLDTFANDLELLGVTVAATLGRQQEPISQETNHEFLKTVAERAEILRAIFVTDLDGKVIAQDLEGDIGYDVSSRPYIRELSAGAESVWSAGLEGVASGQVTVAHARVVRDAAGDPRGYLVFAFYPATLAERIELPLRGNLVLIDQFGVVAYSSRAASAQLDLSTDPDVQAALDGQDVSFAGRDTPFDSGDRFGVLTQIPRMGWAVAYTRSQAELDATLRSALLRDLGLLSLIGIGSLAAFLLAARQVSQPLARLSHAVSSMRHNGPVDLNVRTNDTDIARLRDSFMELQATVATRERELEDQAVVLDTLERVGHALASELDLGATVQAVTDAGLRVLEAWFAALFLGSGAEQRESNEFFISIRDDDGNLDRDLVAERGHVFETLFLGEPVLRIDDVGADERCEREPLSELRKEPVLARNYLAVQVRSRDGSMVGTLVFGQREADSFTARHERLAMGIASWASLAIDNARLFDDAERRKEELERANDAKDEFMGLVSHELRTPITIILGAAHHLIEQGSALDNGTRGDLLEDVRTNASRLSELVHNVLVLARVDQMADDQVEPVLVRRPVEKVAREFRSRKPGRDLTVQFDLGAEVVLGSELYLEQTLSNLISNADKYSPSSKPIRVSVTSDHEHVLISVQDQGDGLSEEDGLHLFEPYYRGRDSQLRAAGFGLGLAVCRGLTEAMGGQLRFANHDAGGAIFTIQLPLAPEMPE